MIGGKKLCTWVILTTFLPHIIAKTQFWFKELILIKYSYFIEVLISKSTCIFIKFEDGAQTSVTSLLNYTNFKFNHNKWGDIKRKSLTPEQPSSQIN